MRPVGSRFLPLFAAALLPLAAGSLPALGGAPLAGRQPPAPPERQFLARTSREVQLLPKAATCTVDPARELFVTDVSVVEDCYRTTWTGSCSPTAAP